MRKLCLLMLLGLMVGVHAAYGAVPEEMRFCGIDLTIDAGARSKIEEIIAKLKRSPTHFQQLVDRANMYFPFIDEAFDLRGVPDDLKYIVIQESSLSSDVVSPSNAVGYWQFKVESARESGLTIDEYVDERKHIFLSSLAAAKYFYNIARYYDNYLYAVIGYNRGPVGALPYTEAPNYGRRKMTITAETHWYALHALAHKLAFQDVVGKADPQTWLQPMSSNGETDVARIAESQGIALEEFKRYNTWISGAKLPAGRNFIYYLPRKGKPVAALQRHVGGGTRQVVVDPPHVDPVIPKKDSVVQPPAKEIPPTVQPIVRNTKKFDYLDPAIDPDYGEEYARMKQGESLVELAVHNGAKVKKLQDYNDFTNYHRPNGGDIVYLKSAKSRKFHIVQPDESLVSISSLYGMTVEELRGKNRMAGNIIYEGQKLSLKKRVSKGQKPILLSQNQYIEEVTPPIEEPAEVVKVIEKPAPKIIVPAGKGVLETEAAAYRLPAFDSKIIVHTVGPNESLWKIARKYGAFAEVIKKLNNLSGTELKQGQQLKVLQITER